MPSASPAPRILVVGAVVVDRLDAPTRVLAARRSRPADLTGRWEFPGGKVERGETPQQALARELGEELKLSVRIGAEIAHPAGAWPISESHELRLFLAEAVGAEPAPGDDHDAVRWLAPAELPTLDWLPADAAALAAVRRAVEARALPWPLPHRRGLRDSLAAAYGAGRGYHDLRHLGEVLGRIEELGLGDDAEVVLAAWFHDAVYAGSSEDEEHSALWAEESLADETGVDAEEVARLVRLTAGHQPAAEDARGQVLCDADLAILAADPGRYDQYVADVRRDFAALDDGTFRAGRAAVLAELLARPHLFATAHARERWEAAARRNLAGELRTLRA